MIREILSVINIITVLITCSNKISFQCDNVFFVYSGLICDFRPKHSGRRTFQPDPRTVETAERRGGHR